MKDNRPDELDRVIDRALHEYASADPLEGLEQRVIERVHTGGSASRRTWWFRAAVAIPALAALIVAIAVVRVPRKPEPIAGIPSAKVPVPAAVRPSGPAPQFAARPEFRPRPQRRAGRAKTLRPATGLAAAVKEPQFPAPAPMTNEERVLTAWAARMPAELTSAFADLRTRAGEPVSVQEIQLPPLPGDGAK